MDKKSGRYNVSAEEDFEPGSQNEVLKNKLGIKNKTEMEELEERELERAELELLSNFDENHQFTSKDIRDIHKRWLEDIYYFAGKYRSVNIGKDDFNFASASRIESLMSSLEKEYLAKYTPCHFTDLDELANALGIVHVELILIHPFREGNGRVARLLADLMALQARQPPLNYESIDQTINPKGFDSYIAAIHAGFKGNYKPIQAIFKTVLKESII